MNIYFLSHEYTAHSGGGIGVSTAILARQLAQDHSVSVITSSRGNPPASYDNNGVTVYAERPFIVRVPILNYWFGDLIHKICYNVQVYRKLRRLEADAVVCATEFGFEGLLPAIMGWRVVTCLATPTFVDELYNDGRISLQNRIISWCERKQTMLSAKIVSKTSFMRTYIAEQWGVPVERMSVIFNAATISEIATEPSPDSPYVLFAGRIDKRKGADILISAYLRIREKFPSLSCIFAGRDLMGIVSAAQKLEPAAQIVHYPSIEHAKLLVLIKNAAIVVAPARFENCSMVCLETLALGRPLIVAENTGSEELIESGISGFTFPQENDEKLAEIMCHCLTHDMSPISRQARERANLYSVEKMRAQYEAVLSASGNRKEKRIAIIHDDMLECGGAQRLVLFLAEAIGADVYTSVVSAEVRQMFPASVRVVPLCDDESCDKDGLRRRRAFSDLDIASDYDVFILSGEDALRAAHRHHPNVYYQHSIPAQFNQDISADLFHMKQSISLYNNSAAEKIWSHLYRLKNRFFRVKLPRCLSSIIEALRYVCAYPSVSALSDFCSYRLTDANFKHDLSSVDAIISNSGYTQDLLAKRYAVLSEVVYPPVKTSKYVNSSINDYWVSVNRIHPLKRIELQLEAFRQMPDEKLYIVGSMIRDEYKDYYKKINELRPGNVTFLGVQDEVALRDLLSRAKGMIFTGRAEAFGMAPVEAMASGKPVIAPNEGGLLETVVHGETGLLIDSLSPEALMEAVQAINAGPNRYSKACMARATLFDEKIFFEKMKAVIAEMM